MATKRKPGRPSLGAGVRLLQVTLTAADRAKLDALRRQLNLGSLAAVVRHLLSAQA